MEFAPMSASSYSRVLNRNRLRTHSSTSSGTVAAITTHHGRSRPAADMRPVPAVTAVTAVSRSSLMLTRRSSPLPTDSCSPLPRDAAEQVPVPDQHGIGPGLIGPGRQAEILPDEGPRLPVVHKAGTAVQDDEVGVVQLRVVPRDVGHP